MSSVESFERKRNILDNYPHEDDPNGSFEYELEYEGSNNFNIDDNEDDTTDESYRTLLKKILSNPDLIMKTSSLLSPSRSSSSKGIPLLYHILIDNSTTSIPIFMVTTSDNDSIINHYDSNFSESFLLQSTTSGPIIKNHYDNDDHENQNEIQTQMIVIDPQQTNNSEHLFKQLPPLFVEFIQLMYPNLKLNDSNQSKNPIKIPKSFLNIKEDKEQLFPEITGDGIILLHHQEYNNLFRNILVVLAYSSIMIVSLCGNYMVCYVIYVTPKLRTTTNILIFSLTISDIMTTILNIPFNCARFLLHHWPFPDSFCILMPTIQVTSIYVSALTMAAICLHRHRSILGTKTNIIISSRFNHSSCSMTRVKIWILFIWFVSILLALPHSLFNVVIWTQLPNGHIIRRCRAQYPKSIQEQMPLFLSLLATVTQFILPLGFTAILYARIGRIIAHQGRIAKHYCDELNQRLMEAKRKRILMLILIVVGFLITWFPLTLYHLLIDFHLVHFYWNIFLALHIWAMTSVCYNPFIYCFMNEDFRKHYKQILTHHSFLCYFCLFFGVSHLDTIIPTAKNIHGRSFCRNFQNFHNKPAIMDDNGDASLVSNNLRILNEQKKPSINFIYKSLTECHRNKNVILNKRKENNKENVNEKNDCIVESNNEKILKHKIIIRISSKESKEQDDYNKNDEENDGDENNDDDDDKTNYCAYDTIGDIELGPYDRKYDDLVKHKYECHFHFDDVEK